MRALNVRNMRNTRQSGFTIIELVVVILLLGILTATALPRFLDVTDEAHAAVVDGVEAGFGTGIALFRAQWVGSGQPTTAIPEFGSLFADATSGYPQSTTDSADPLTHAECKTTIDNVLQLAGQPNVVASAGVATGTTAGAGIGVSGATAGVDFVTTVVASTPPACEYYYVAQTSVATATVPYIAYVPDTGSVVTGTSAALP